MKLRKVLKASLFYKEEPVELDLLAAEIRESKALLHTKNEGGVTYLVRSDRIEIVIRKGFSLLQEHIIKMAPQNKGKKTESKSKAEPPQKPNQLPFLTETRIPLRRLPVMSTPFSFSLN